MHFLEVLVLILSLSFLGYGIAYFTSPTMKSEFTRFGLDKFGTFTATLEITRHIMHVDGETSTLKV